MRIMTERRLERLETADAQEGVVYLVSDTLPGDEASISRVLTHEEWEAIHCHGATCQ